MSAAGSTVRYLLKVPPRAYELRAGLPVPPERLRISCTSSSAAAPLQAAYNYEPATVTMPPFLIPSGTGVGMTRAGGGTFPNPKKADLKRRLEGLDSTLATAQAAYPAAVANAMFVRWVETRVCCTWSMKTLLGLLLIAGRACQIQGSHRHDDSMSKREVGERKRGSTRLKHIDHKAMRARVRRSYCCH